MLWIFKPVNNPYWFEIREITFFKFRKPRIKAVSIQEYMWIIDELPVFKCKKDFNPKKGYYKQFNNYI